MKQKDQSETKKASTDSEGEYEFDVTSGHSQPEMSVRWGGREVVTDIPIETPSFPYALLKYCHSGRGVMEWETDRWEIEAGMVFWAAPKYPTIVTVKPGAQMTNYALFLAGQETNVLYDQFLKAPVGVARMNEPKRIENLFLVLMEEGRGTSIHREENCVLLTRVLLRRIEAQSLTRLPSNSLARQTFKRCREYIAGNFMQLNSLSEVADWCEISIPYLCRLFDQYFDCSAYDYLKRLKMSRAENLLLRPHAPIHEVAVAVGYKDVRLFARNFKAVYGKSPTEYRQLHAIAADI